MVGQDDYEKLLELQKTLRVERFDQDECIIHQDDIAENAYVIVSGRCKVKVSYTHNSKTKKSEHT